MNDAMALHEVNGICVAYKNGATCQPNMLKVRTNTTRIV